VQQEAAARSRGRHQHARSNDGRRRGVVEAQEREGLGPEPARPRACRREPPDRRRQRPTHAL
ncbi:MAG: hypothetical protein AVDCRST_MAG85-413, partial [uncultured Solirubrobacteraceae bacterium]